MATAKKPGPRAKPGPKPGSRNRTPRAPSRATASQNGINVPKAVDQNMQEIQDAAGKIGLGLGRTAQTAGGLAVAAVAAAWAMDKFRKIFTGD